MSTVDDPRVTEALTEYLPRTRWFGGKGRSIRVAAVHRLGWLDPDVEGTEDGLSPDERPRVRIELATVEYEGGETEIYQVPLAYYARAQDRLGHALVGHWKDEELGDVHAYDAVHDRHATAQWLAAFAREHRDDALVFHRLSGHDLDLATHSTLFSGEQSNSSVAFGEDCLMKVFRKVTPGLNPDIEIHEQLTGAGNEHVAALYGWLEAPLSESADGSPLQLAMLQQFLRTASDGWGLALASVRELFSEVGMHPEHGLHPESVGGDFAAESHRLGVATAEVHDVLADLFPTERWRGEQLARLAEQMTGRLDDAVAVVPELAGARDRLVRAFDALATLSEPLVAQRVHGDYHLGQTLRTVRGWKIVDFEGEPAKSLESRVRPDSGWRDVAGMLRSFDYAAHAAEADVDGDEDVAGRAQEWAARNRSAFLSGYVEASGRTPSHGLSHDQEVLLRAYEIDKAVYEAVYEARNRPTWLPIPLGAVARLAGEDPADPHYDTSDDLHAEEADS